MAGFRLLLHGSLLLDGGCGGGRVRDDSLPPQLGQPVEVLLRRLWHSKLHVGVGIPADATPEEAGFLKERTLTYSLECLTFQALLDSTSTDELIAKWRRTEKTCIMVFGHVDEALYPIIYEQNWRLICVGAGEDHNIQKDILYIQRVEELLLAICKLIKKELCDGQILTVGHLMKPAREDDFAKRGALPLCPTDNGLIFVPLSFDSLLESQLQEVDMVLHKVTDEIVSIDPNAASDFREAISLSDGMSKLVRHVQEYPAITIIDPFENIYPLLDRLQIQQIVLGLEQLDIGGSCKLRAPHYIKVDDFWDPNILTELTKAALTFPLIVKPQVACGISDAHNMALIFYSSDFRSLRVSLPAILQEYVDHGSKIYKCYVLGEKVFYAVRKSMPNSIFLQLSSVNSAGGPITFNSLKTLPGAASCEDTADSQQDSLNINAVKMAAKWLQGKLGLTIFGFDVVIQEGTGDHVIVDLNYLPSFKEVPDADAVPAFWNAIRSAHDRKTLKVA